MDPHIDIVDGFYLSRIGRQDKAAYLEHFADPEITKNLLVVPYPYTEAHADWWLNYREANARDPEIVFGIRDASGFLIGSIGVVSEMPAGTHKAEFGYWLAKAHRGRGLMPRAIRAFTQYGLNLLGLQRLYATPFAHNIASQRALEKAGYTREGCMRQHYCKAGELIDAIMYGFVRGDQSE